MKKRIVILGSGLAAACVIRSLKPTSHSLYFQQQANLELACAECGDIRNLSELTAIQPDLIILAGYKPIVPQHHIDQFRMINLHPSMLPKYRGMHSVVWAMLNGEAEVGLTLHEVDALVDNGAIIWQATESVADHSAYRLLELLHEKFEACAAAVIEDYLSGEIKPIPQDFDKATFVGIRRLEDCRIDFGQPNEYLRRFFQALQKPYPLPFLTYNDTNYAVTDAVILDKDYRERNGVVVYKDEHSVWVKTADGVMRILEVQDSEGRLLNPATLFRNYTRL